MIADDLARLRSLAETATPGLRFAATERGQWAAYPQRGEATLEDAQLSAALDPQTVLALLDAAALGLAWNRVEAALPEGWGIKGLAHGSPQDETEWVAGAGWGETIVNGATSTRGHGPTPTAALLALAEKLEPRE